MIDTTNNKRTAPPPTPEVASGTDAPGSTPRFGFSVESKIDVCRGLFAFLVVSAHALDLCRVLHPRAFASLPPDLDRLIYFTVEHGIYWVMGFFVISGYCIHLSVDRLMGPERFPLGSYMIARLTRILPLYYAALLFTIAVEALIADARPPLLTKGLNPLVLLSQVFVLQNLTQTYGSFGASWSITNELFYYLFYGVLASLAVRRRGRPAWVGMAVCLAVATLMQALYATVAHSPYVLSLGLLFGLGINWFLGALVASHAAELVRFRAVRVVSRAWLPLLAAVIYAREEGIMPNQALFLLSGLAFALMLVRFHAASSMKPRVALPPRVASVVHVLGLASYPTYLFHTQIQMLLGSAILRWGLISDCRVTWLVLVGVGIVSGVVLGLVVERPLMTWRAGLLKRLKSTRLAPPRRVPSPALGIQR